MLSIVLALKQHQKPIAWMYCMARSVADVACLRIYPYQRHSRAVGLPKSETTEQRHATKTKQATDAGA